MKISEAITFSDPDFFWKPSSQFQGSAVDNPKCTELRIQPVLCFASFKAVNKHTAHWDQWPRAGGGTAQSLSSLLKGFFFLEENRASAEASCKLSPGLWRIFHVIAEGYLIKWPNSETMQTNISRELIRNLCSFSDLLLTQTFFLRQGRRNGGH